VSSSNFSMHVKFAAIIPAKRFLSLLRHSAVRTYYQTDFGEICISWYSAQFSQLALFCNDKGFACTSFRKIYLRLRSCVEMREHVQAYYFGTIRAIPTLVYE